MVDWAELFLITIFALYVVTLGRYYRRIDAVRLNPLGVVAGLLSVVSPFLPWVNFDASVSLTIFEQQISAIAVGAFNLPALIELVSEATPFVQQYVPEYATFVRNLQWVCILTLVLLVLAGIIAIFKGMIGGVLGLLGMLLFTTFGGNFYQSITLNIGYIYTSLTIGYFIGWAGCFAGFASHFTRRKREVSETAS